MELMIEFGLEKPCFSDGSGKELKPKQDTTDEYLFRIENTNLIIGLNFSPIRTS